VQFFQEFNNAVMSKSVTFCLHSRHLPVTRQAHHLKRRTIESLELREEPMVQYVGLTDDPQRVWQEHGCPADWQTYGPFTTERHAKAWEAYVLKTGCKGGSAGAGWKYGYSYLVSPFTGE
jgi:hypothetical protein